MPTVNGWTLDLEALPGWNAAQRWELIELPNADMAFVAYDIGEIGVSKDAGYLAVYRGKATPVLAFHPRPWVVSPSVDAVQHDQTGTQLLVYVVNARIRYLLVDLERKRYAWVPIPNEAYNFRVHKIGDLVFEKTGHFYARFPMEPFVVDAGSLRFLDYVRQDGVDVIAASLANT